jgi:hypothetical protein
MSHYLLSMYQPAGPPPPDVQLGAIMHDVGAVDQELREAGIRVFSNGLDLSGAEAVVRVAGGETLVTDGPFAASKEHLGGITIIDVPDQATAIEWAGRLARASTLPVEVRRFQDRA